MNRKVFFSLLMLLFAATATAQKKYSLYGVGFYNLENLFDTCHDVGKNDYQYLPDGQNKWTGLKYSHKLRNMARVLAEMGTDRLPGLGCAAIGVSEVENDRCLKDLCEQEPLKKHGFKNTRGEDTIETDRVKAATMVAASGLTIALIEPKR